jgi:hypothetical protein
MTKKDVLLTLRGRFFLDLKEIEIFSKKLVITLLEDL